MNLMFRFGVLWLASSMVFSGTARATEDSAKGAARDLANEAQRDFAAGRFEEAGMKLQRAYEIAKVPTLAVWAARAMVKRGHLVAASELYRQATLLTPNDLWVGDAQQKAQADAEKELDEVKTRIPKLCLRVEGAAANEIELALDGVKVATALLGIDIPTDPGKRHFVGKRGVDVVDLWIDLAEGERKEASLKFNAAAFAYVQPAKAAEVSLPPPGTGQKTENPTLVAPTYPISVGVAMAPEPGQSGLSTVPAPALTTTPSAEPANRWQRTWGWMVTGVGVAGLLTGVVTGMAVMSNTGLRNDCPNGACPASKSGSVNTYNLMRDVSAAGFIVGGVCAVAGVTLLLWTPRYETEPRMALWLGPSSAGVKGAF